MGAKITRFPDGCEKDAPDLVSGLTSRDIHNVQHSWSHIYADYLKHGEDLMKRLFRHDPDSKSSHKTFRNMDDEQLSKSAVFKAYVISFMTHMNMVLTHLQQPDVAIALLCGFEDSLRSLPKKYLESLDKVYKDFLEKELKTSEGVLRSWSKALQFMHQHLHKAHSGR